MGHMPPSPAAMQKMKPSELYNMMDKDKDGFVTKEEFLKFQEKVFDHWDKNHTGRVGQAMFTDAG
jgi:Ca2+-binding EF-hand superfamily protein